MCVCVCVRGGGGVRVCVCVCVCVELARLCISVGYLKSVLGRSLRGAYSAACLYLRCQSVCGGAFACI